MTPPGRKAQAVAGSASARSQSRASRPPSRDERARYARSVSVRLPTRCACRASSSALRQVHPPRVDVRVVDLPASRSTAVTLIWRRRVSSGRASAELHGSVPSHVPVPPIGGRVEDAGHVAGQPVEDDLDVKLRCPGPAGEHADRRVEQVDAEARAGRGRAGRQHERAAARTADVPRLVSGPDVGRPVSDQPVEPLSKPLFAKP